MHMYWWAYHQFVLIKCHNTGVWNQRIETKLVSWNWIHFLKCEVNQNILSTFNPKKKSIRLLTTSLLTARAESSIPIHSKSKLRACETNAEEGTEGLCCWPVFIDTELTVWDWVTWTTPNEADWLWAETGREAGFLTALHLAIRSFSYNFRLTI